MDLLYSYFGSMTKIKLTFKLKRSKMDLFLSLQSTINGLADRCGCIGTGGTSAPPAPPRAHETRSIGDLHRPSLHTQFPPATPYRIASHRIASRKTAYPRPPRRGSHRNRLGRYETQRNTPRRHGPLRLSSPDPARGQLQIRDLPSARVAPRTAPHPTPARRNGRWVPPPSLRSPPHESRGRPEP